MFVQLISRLGRIAYGERLHVGHPRIPLRGDGSPSTQMTGVDPLSIKIIGLAKGPLPGSNGRSLFLERITTWLLLGPL